MPPLITTEQHLPLAKKAMTFIDESPDPFHAVQTSADMLSAAGFEELDETVPYSGKLAPGTFGKMLVSSAALQMSILTFSLRLLQVESITLRETSQRWWRLV